LTTDLVARVVVDAGLEGEDAVLRDGEIALDHIHVLCGGSDLSVESRIQYMYMMYMYV
jgi:hypothetical protein